MTNIHIDISIPNTIEPFKELTHILNSLLAHKYLANVTVLPTVDFHVGERSLTMKVNEQPMANHASTVAVMSQHKAYA